MFVLNSTTISGRLGQDPESIADGKGIRFSLAVEESFKKNEQWEKRTNWIPVTVWGSVAEQMRKKLSKGSEVALEGKLREERWETKEGEKRSKVGVVAFAFHVEYRGENGGPPASDVPPDQADLATATPGPDDDIPF